MMSNPPSLARDSNNVEYLAHVEINYFATHSLVISYMGRAGTKKCFVRGEKKHRSRPARTRFWSINFILRCWLRVSVYTHTHTHSEESASRFDSREHRCVWTKNGRREFVAVAADDDGRWAKVFKNTFVCAVWMLWALIIIHTEPAAPGSRQQPVQGRGQRGEVYTASEACEHQTDAACAESSRLLDHSTHTI